jgi:hypothetical protein
MLGLRPEEVEERATAFVADRDARLVDGLIEEETEEFVVLRLGSLFDGEERRDDIDERFERGNPSENPESCRPIRTEESMGD